MISVPLIRIRSTAAVRHVKERDDILPNIDLGPGLASGPGCCGCADVLPLVLPPRRQDGQLPAPHSCLNQQERVNKQNNIIIFSRR